MTKCVDLCNAEGERVEGVYCSLEALKKGYAYRGPRRLLHGYSQTRSLQGTGPDIEAALANEIRHPKAQGPHASNGRARPKLAHRQARQIVQQDATANSEGMRRNNAL